MVPRFQHPKEFSRKESGFTPDSLRVDSATRRAPALLTLPRNISTLNPHPALPQSHNQTCKAIGPICCFRHFHDKFQHGLVLLGKIIYFAA